MTNKLVIPTFEGIFMLGVVIFLFSQFSPIELLVFDKTFLYPIKNIDFLSSNLKRYFTSILFLYGSGGLKIAKLATFWTNLCAL